VVFGNSHPVEVEVGFGKGQFLLTSCQGKPAVNFLGIEILRKYQLFTATRLAKRALHNVRLVKADARDFLSRSCASDSVRAIHVYFPDPWWKRRHWKRRLFTPDFVVQCARVLEPQGKLKIATDVEEYFRLIGEVVSQQPSFHESPTEQPRSAEEYHDCLTNFERKSASKGRPIFRAEFARVTSPQAMTTAGITPP
jgi:tRNA (guanine-N7-)-methyltransferase